MAGSMRPLAIDLYAGLFGWSEGLTAEGWRTIGFDLEDMHAKFGLRRPEHCQLVIQDVLTLHGSQFKGAALIVASPPCQAYSYRSMPWKRAKALPPPDNSLFDACFRIQREACEAAGRHIPMIVENVRGAQKWVGPARWNYGSFYLFGDVPALMPITLRHSDVKAPGMNWSDQTKRGQDFTRLAGKRAHEAINGGTKVPSEEGRRTDHGKGARFTSRDCGLEAAGIKNKDVDGYEIPRTSSKSPARKLASALIAKIPEPLSRHIARTFYPVANSPKIGV